MRFSVFLLVKKLFFGLKRVFFLLPKIHLNFNFLNKFSKNSFTFLSLVVVLNSFIVEKISAFFASRNLLAIYLALTVSGFSFFAYKQYTSQHIFRISSANSTVASVLSEQSNVQDYLITFNNEALFNLPVTFNLNNVVELFNSMCSHIVIYHYKCQINLRVQSKM